MKKSGPEWGWLDALLLLLLAGAGAWLAYRAAVELEYHWHWEAIPQYLLRRGDQGWAAGSLTQGLWCTLRLSFWAALLALPLGLAAALARLGRLLYLRLLARTLIELLRNLPPLVLLFLGYYFLADPFAALLADDWPHWAKAHPSLAHLAARLWAPPAELAPFLAALMTLALLEGAYVQTRQRGRPPRHRIEQPSTNLTHFRTECRRQIRLLKNGRVVAIHAPMRHARPLERKQQSGDLPRYFHRYR